MQELIDESPWGQVPGAVRRLRARKRILRHLVGGKKAEDLTDVDAVAVRDGVLLVVDCKSRLANDRVLTGDFSYARTRAEYVEREARKAQRTAEYLRAHPVGPGGSYDLSAFTHIEVIVCTPTPIYIERAVAPDQGDTAGELQAVREVLPGLRRVASSADLAEWLYVDDEGAAAGDRVV